MNRAKRRVFSSHVVLGLAIAACGDSAEDVVGGMAGAPPTDTGGNGGMPTGAGGVPSTGGAGGDGGVPSTGGGGGAAQCETPADCPGADDECQTKTCSDGACGFDYAAQGTQLASQTAGDCLLAVCDGAGAATTEVDDADLPDDLNECTEDLCTAGQPANEPIAAGTSCSQGGGSVCDGAGNCTACVPAEQRSCYSGAAGTDGVGTCVAGIETCDSAGLWEGVCAGEVVPAIADDCSTQLDESCGTSDDCSGHIWSRRFLESASRPGAAAGRVAFGGPYTTTIDFGGGVTVSPYPNIGTENITGPGQLYVAALDDSNGQALWARSFDALPGPLGTVSNPDSISATRAVVDPMGNVIVGGGVKGIVDFGTGQLSTDVGSIDAFITKLDPLGNTLWANSYNWEFVPDTPNADVITEVVSDNAGNLYVSANTGANAEKYAVLMKLDPTGATIAENGWVFNSIGFAEMHTADISLAAGLVLAAGPKGTPFATLDGTPACESGTPKAGAAWVASMTTSLSCTMLTGFPVAITSISGDSAGNIFVSGTFSGSPTIGGQTQVSAGGTDIFVAKLDSAHNVIWVETFGGTGSERVYSIDVDASDNIVMFGRFNGTTNFGGGSIATAGQNDLFLVELDTNGVAVSIRTFGGTGSEPNTSAPLPEGAGLIIGDTGNLFITSSTNGPINFGGGVLAGTNGFVVAAIEP